MKFGLIICERRGIKLVKRELSKQDNNKQMLLDG